MPKCSVCGGEMEKLPAWLDGVKVVFRCGRCPETAPQGINPASTLDAEEEAEPTTPDGEEVDASLEEEIEAEFEEEAEEA